FVGALLAGWLAIEHALISVDPSVANRRPQSRTADCARSRPGVKACDDKTRYMLRCRAIAPLVLPFLPKTPSGPQQPRGLAPGKPALTWLAPDGQHDGRHSRAEAGFPVVPNGRSQIFKFASSGGYMAPRLHVFIARLLI